MVLIEETVPCPASDAVALPGRSWTGDLATPLSEVTFAVVDLETTGTSPASDRIIEVGAARFRGGVCIGTFSTLVNPARPVPPPVVALTGITPAMVAPAPGIGAVLGPLVDFVGDAVLVGHNLRFDTAFLDAALAANGHPRLGGPRVDTLAMARRLVADETTSLRLASLALLFRTPTAPSHRALDDALATAEIFHRLVERAASLGVTHLDDLLSLPAGALGWAKLPLAADLPRAPGVYLCRDAGGRLLFVGKAANLRTRVRSWLARPARRSARLLRHTAFIDHVACIHPGEAAALERQLVAAHRPRFNRRRRARRCGAPAPDPWGSLHLRCGWRGSP
ncbi:MAG: exonuclease domain-containing protein [Acidimicrobiia bacterium]